MRLLELFAGSRSVGRVAESKGWEVFSVDVEPFEGIDLVKDIEFLERSDIPFIPDVIWASPTCTTYSIAAISKHRNGWQPKSDEAVIADQLLDKTIEIFSWFPTAKFFMENPRAMMRKMPQVQGIHRETVSYCQYGDETRMKPTDIWTNSDWVARPMCWNGRPNCHQLAPRGSSTGTQGLRNAYERGKIPTELIQEILDPSARYIPAQSELFYEVANQ